MRLLRDPYFFAASISHFFVDLLSGQVALILVFLSPTLGLSNAEIGLVIMLFLMVSSLTQPLFGWLADQYNFGWFAAGGLLWLASWFALAMFVSGRAALPLLVIGGLGFATYHPVGTERATTRGRVLMAGRAATAASIFFLFGQAGLGLGPAVGGLLLDNFGLAGIVLLSGLALPIVANTFYWFSRSRQPAWIVTGISAEVSTSSDVLPHKSQGVWWMLPVFVLLVALRATPQQVSMTFIPKLLQDQGYEAVAYGAVTSLFMIGSAVGGLSGGIAADRWGRCNTIIWTLLAAALPLYFYPVSQGVFMYALVFLAGAFTGASHSIVVVLAQSFMPNRMALASGMTLGFMFSSGSLGTYLFGLLADQSRLASVLQLNAFLAGAAVLCGLMLRRRC